MKTMVVGASKGLGRALIDGLGEHGDTLIGVSRTRPQDLTHNPGVVVNWVEADLGEPVKAARIIEQAVVEGGLDTLIYNLGIWEAFAFDPATTSSPTATTKWRLSSAAISLRPSC